MNGKNLRELCLSELPHACELKKYLHCHPETSGREFQTMLFLEEQLKKMGYDYTVIPDGGILAHIDGTDADSVDSPHVLLRADCDALPIKEDDCNGCRKRDYKSLNPEAGHMCGHDSHMAMLLSACAILKQMEDDIRKLRGRIYILFERGEEGGLNYYYVLKHIQEQKIRIDSCFALHVDPTLKTGSICLEAGPCHAGNVNFEIELTGKGGHGSRPDRANNPLDCFVAMMNSLNMLRMKYIQPQDMLTVNIGTVQCGTRRNIVPDTLKFSGTCRFYRSESGRIFKERFRRIITETASLFDCGVSFNVFTGPSLAQLNDKNAAALSQRAFAEVFPEVEQIFGKEPEMSSESFGVLCSYYPGMMGMLGVANKEKGTCEMLHNPHFDLDTDAMPYGIAAHVSYVLKYLEEAPHFPFRPFEGDIDAMMVYTDRKVPERLDDKNCK